MTSRRILMTVAVAASLAFTSAALTFGVAHADPTTPAPAPAPKPKKKPAAKPPAPLAKPKPAATPKDTPAEAPKPSAGASTAHEVVEHESRIEFDERMVRGQSAAGAIFLFQRTPSDLKSIVEVPDSFRQKTIEMLQPQRGTP
jgi:outer membrane biosynthesis protein TonB